MKVVNLFTLKRLYDVTDSRNNIRKSATLFPASPSHKIHFNKINSAGIAGLLSQSPCRFAWQLSAWDSQTPRPSSISYRIAATA